MYAVFFIDFLISNAMKILWRSRIFVLSYNYVYVFYGAWRQWAIKSMFLRGENPRVVWIKNAPVLLENKSRLATSLCEHHLRPYITILHFGSSNKCVFKSWTLPSLQIMDIILPLAIMGNISLCNHGRYPHPAILDVIISNPTLLEN